MSDSLHIPPLHGEISAMLRRHLTSVVIESLRHFPVVLVIGARQVGKSTMVRQIARSAWPARYLTLDDRTVLDSALTDPDAFVQGLATPAVIDEVQRAPDLLRAIKLAVDLRRTPGRFLLTGSAHPFTLTTISETLAGRVAVHELRPFAWSELLRVPAPRVADLFDPAARRALAATPRTKSSFRDLAKSITAGAFPDPALMRSESARRTWFESYRQTYLERDLRDVAEVAHLPEFGRLMVAIALRSGSLLNVAELSRDIGLAETTTRRHIQLLTQTFQVDILRPFLSNRFKQLVKTPKVYWTDTGMATHLAAAATIGDLERRNLLGPFLETWVHSEIRKLLALEREHVEVSFWGARGGREVDFILERGGEIVGIEVKSSAAVRGRDLEGLRACRSRLEKRWRLGVVLYTGHDTLSIDDKTIAVPICRFFGPSR
jgi:hypothetical protein